MSKRMLRKLSPYARTLVTVDNYISLSQALFSEYISGLEREISIEPMLSLFPVAVKKFDGSKRDRISSDGWLAPRIHATLKLSRREASDLPIWEYLSIVIPDVREYIIWRWGNEDGHVRDLKRIYGSDRRHALGRLWWTAELTRNGGEYSTTIDAFDAGQDLIQYLTDVDFSHNRAAAIAYVDFVTSLKGDSEWKKKRSKDVGVMLNHVLTTIMLDHLVPNASIDMEAYSVWIEQEPDETRMLKDLPEGPNEPKVSDKAIQKVVDLLSSLEIDSEATA